MFKDYTVNEFVDKLSSKEPTPGGGSVAALVGALSAGLNNMVYSLTVGKKSYSQLEEDEKNKIISSIENTENIREKFLIAMEEDKEAFEELMSVFKLPKSTDLEVQLRNKEVRLKTIKALEAPLNLARNAMKLYDEIKIAVKYGNKGAISDAGVSAILLHSTIESAIMNVKINLASLDDSDYKNSIIQEIDSIKNKSQVVKENLVKIVYEIIG